MICLCHELRLNRFITYFSDAIACILDLINDVDPTVLDTYPKLKVFREDMLALPAFDGIKNYHAYFKRSSP